MCRARAAMTTRGPLPIPYIVWRDGAPTAVGYDDIYFNPDDGIAETRHVFLAGTGLPDRWRTARHFVIAELGFGTGLNFLCAWDLWNRTRSPGGHLHFVSVEGAPLTTAQLSSAHDAFPEFAKLSARLRAAYPPRARGAHLVHLADDVTLHLLFGEASEMLRGLEARVDAWFLDGFAPAKNPAMWTRDVVGEIARCSAPGARAASFTVAGDVRRALQDAGFAVQKTPGFGRKREMVQATFEGAARPDDVPWFALPAPRAPGRIAVIGAGIAGVSCAWALHRHGCDVALIDHQNAHLTRASNTPSGLVMPRLGAALDAPSRFYAHAHRFAVATYRGLDVYSAGGALHLPPKPDQVARLEKTAATGLFDPARIALLTPSDASARAGTTVTSPGICFADGGQLDGPAYLSRAAREIGFRNNATIGAFTREGEVWRILDEAGQLILEVDTVIVACAMAAGRLLPDAQFPLRARHGQITRVRGGTLPLPVAYGGYAAPAGTGLWIGATHTPASDDGTPAFDPKADQANLAALAGVMPDLAAASAIEGNWFGIRATTPDQLPIAGPVTDAASFTKTFARLAHGDARQLPPVDYQTGLYAVTGLGSRGFASAPLLGEILAAQILGLPSPVERDVRHMLHPARFTARDIRRGTMTA